MAFDRIMTIKLHLFEHDDEKIFLAVMINVMSWILKRFDMATIDIQLDDNLARYATDKHMKEIARLKYGSE